MEEKIDIKSMTLDELKESFAQINLPKFRAEQVYKWLQEQGVTSFDEMSNISKELRKQLSDKYIICNCSIEKKLVSEYDSTVKYLFKLNDSEFIESVLMKYKYGYTLCVSTQVGCKMGCSFCASTIGGFCRNLRPSEILSQIHTAQNDNGVRVSHIVLMGMGEPMDNFDNVIRFLNLVTDEKGLNISMRHISLSTCGVVDGIYKLLEKNFQLTLSVSLHAPNDEIRSRIMPVNKKWGVDELIEACKKYIAKTNRRISFEYAMIDGVNDTDECARELARLLKGMLCHVNLIPANEVRENDYKRSSKARLEKFSEILQSKGITTTIRRTLGSD
ncbi:MAG: 23S rRNA (adenine(2503)-C(2))-methyltransferase RlmN, partial [Clostridiales bacterium]|nr:23S rRNA (adenine(2503)-C(2))-methyltransferase RlmN [Clostridiales bacterium]